MINYLCTAKQCSWFFLSILMWILHYPNKVGQTGKQVLSIYQIYIKVMHCLCLMEVRLSEWDTASVAYVKDIRGPQTGEGGWSTLTSGPAWKVGRGTPTIIRDSKAGGLVRVRYIQRLMGELETLTNQPSVNSSQSETEQGGIYLEHKDV